MKMKKKEKIPNVTKLTLESLKEVTGYFQKGKPFKCGGVILRPSKGKREYPCTACWSCNFANKKRKIRMDVRKFVCKACCRADEDINYNWYHYLEV